LQSRATVGGGRLVRRGTGVRVRYAEEACLFATQQVVPRLAGMLLPLAREPRQE